MGVSSFLSTQFGLLLGTALGVGVTVLLGLWVNALVAKVRAIVKAEPPTGVSREEWERVTVTDPKPGEWLGGFERLLFFIAIWGHSWEIVAGWLVFKVGSKWEVWTNIVKVPESVGAAGGDALTQLRARHDWGTRILQSFLVGTIANILCGIAAAAVARTAVGLWESR